jgi:hypothetical protein
MTIPPPQGQPPNQLLLIGGDVTIWLLPLVWHTVVFGPVFVHCGGAATATGATAIAAETPAAAKSVVR